MKEIKPDRPRTIFPRSFLARAETRWLIAATLFVFFLTALTWSTPEPVALQATLTQAPGLSGTLSAQGTQPFTGEILANRDQTAGIILASVALVAIILAGAFIGSRKKPM